MSNLLEINNLGVKFITDKMSTNVVRGINLSLKQGETLGLVGESGSGKTVTALAMLRLLPSPAGKIISGMVAGDNTNLNLKPYSSLRFS